MELGGLTPEQQIRLADLLHWYETVGKHLRPVNQRPQERGSPVPIFLGKASGTITSTGGSAVLWTSTAASTVAEATTNSSANVYKWIGQDIASGDAVMIARHYRSGRLYAWNSVPASSDLASGYASTGTLMLISDNGALAWMTLADALELLTGYNGSNDQSIGHDASGTPEWQDDEDC